jgi:hypothetical protein
MQRAAILPSAASLVSSDFSTVSYKRHGFREKLFEHKMCVFILSTILFETLLIVRRILQDIVINMQRLHVKYTLFLLDFNES